ncbi:hypothetical protein [Flavobacterium chilense]|uniref:Uncharacterized protein n=1 Tax=Flavobacterium chilense TaxID=946677 RepID=A0A1M7CHQ7_9FLAO|nr:hypothetical protein [Flavobacterium chilense]SHL66740.1 hypothetical protein SAMN05444484_102159 [Flavobacterium chilense]
MDKKELFQSMINSLTEFQIIGKFDSGDIIINFLPIASAKLCDFEYAIFHDKKWYKVVASKKDSKIKIFEQNDNVWETVLSVLKDDSVENEPVDLIDLAKHFVTEANELNLEGELIGKTLWIAETLFGKLLGFIDNNEEFISMAIEIDSELYFNPNETQHSDFAFFCKITKRYYDAFVRVEKSKYLGLTSNGQKIKF